MKKLVGFIVVVAVALAVYFGFIRNHTSTNIQNNQPSNTEASASGENSSPTSKVDQKLLERLRNVTVTASEDGGTVTLSGGEAQFSIDGTTKKGTVSVGGVATEVTAGSRQDVIAYITVNPGNGQYLVLFEDKGSSLVQKSLVFLGNNVTVQSIVTAPLGAKDGPEYAISVKGLEKGFETTYIYTVVGGEIDVAKALKL